MTLASTNEGRIDAHDTRSEPRALELERKISAFVAFEMDVFVGARGAKRSETPTPSRCFAELDGGQMRSAVPVQRLFTEEMS